MTFGADDALPLGAIVHDRYRVVNIVGRGGVGTVYQVNDILFGKNNSYALKELIDQSEGARKQFANEAQWLQAIDHRSIPKVREYFDWNDRLYLVMDFVDGENLEQKLLRASGQALPEDQVINWLLPICDALDYLHAQRPPILHRDVKPANIIVTPSGHPVLVDLGIAKEHLPGAGQTATFVRKAGTEGYAPPEQYTTAGMTGPWSDVYGLGATMYELLTGRVPPTAVERVALDTVMVRPRELNPAISPHVEDTILRAIAIRPADRFQTVGDVARALMGQRTYKSSQGSLPTMTERPVSGYNGARSPTGPSSPSGVNFAPGMEPGFYNPSNPWVTSDPRLGPNPNGPGPYTQPPSAPGPGSYSDLPYLGSEAEGHLVVPVTPYGSPPERYPRGFGAGAPLTVPVNRVEDLMAAGSVVSAPQLGRAGRSGTLAGSLQEVEKSDRRLRWWLLGGLLAVALLIGGGYFAFTNLGRIGPPNVSSPSATVNGYYDALKARDYNAAWNYTANSRNNPSFKTDWTSAQKSQDDTLGSVTSAQITSTTQDSTGRVTVTVAIQRGEPSNSSSNYTLVLSQYGGSSWLIESFSAT
jgi:eukaryotic-like serine/threonine-protein kinase